ncbi:hypothetical protein GBAR_LOCUS1232 [Geodia barretti]|uniref:Uncharacterized protein n=1 Tax=Geodia barretti TaxID=519541 RepID=A0AA35QVS1_GEOBA|nr:hypothetical protein GBAR_LOCUS1232 [Geodia barretti]
MLICKMTEDKIRGPLTPAQRVWLGPRTAPGTSSSSASVPVTLSSDPLCPSSTQKVRSLFSSSSSTTPSHQHLSAPPSRMVVTMTWF